MSYSLDCNVNFGTGSTGLATVGYKVVDKAGTTIVAHTTSGVTELVSGSGIYGGTVAGLDNTKTNFIVWDTGTTPNKYATDAIPIYTNTLINIQLDGSNYVKSDCQVNSDKTGYSLTQAFPTNFSALAINGSGQVTVGTNADKTGYALTGAQSITSLTITGGVAVTNSNTNQPGLSITGNGTGDGAIITGGSGAGANGLHCVGGGTGGSGIFAQGSGPGGSGAKLFSGSGGHTPPIAGEYGCGLQCTANNTGGFGIVASTTSGLGGLACAGPGADWTVFAKGDGIVAVGTIGLGLDVNNSNLLAAGGNVTVQGYASGQDPATLVLDALGSDHDITNTIGAEINAIAAILSQTAPNVTITSPIVSDGTTSIIRGDDYRSADGRALVYTDSGSNFPDNSTVQWIAYLNNNAVLTKTGTLSPATGANKSVTVELTNTDTAALTQNLYDYALVFTWPDTHSATLVTGKLFVNAR